MRRHRRALLRSALGVALAVVVFALVVPRIASYGSVAHRLGHISAGWTAALALAALLDILTAALPWLVLLPQLSFFNALGFTQASTALTLVLPGGAPLGMAISFGFLRRLRVSRGQAAFAVALTGIWSQTTIFVYPLMGALLVFASGDLSPSAAAIAAASAAAGALLVGLAVLAMRRPRFALWLGELAAEVADWFALRLRRDPPSWSGKTLVRFRQERVVLLRRQWPALTAATLANQLTAFLVFEFSLRAVGISYASLSLSASFLAWAIGRVISSLPLTPGGIGVVELGLIGTLVGFGAPHAHVVAAVLLYRALIIVPTLIVGTAGLLVLRRPAAPATT